MAARGSRLRVLYLHGLEEDASSPKPSAIAEDSRVKAHVPALDIYHTKRHSPLRYALFASVLPAVCIALTSFHLLGGFVHAAASTLVLAALGGYLFRSRLIAFAASRAYDDSYAVARTALQAFEPDVVVGFSWGGALACRLLAEGLWSGPTLLLAPASTKLLTVMGRPALPIPLPKKVRIVHSRADTVIPIEHSRALCRAAAVELHEVDEMKHNLWGISDNLVPWLLELGGRGSEGLHHR